jgi:hypothetical protein
MSKTEKTEIGPRAFANYLTSLEEGRLHAEASEQTQVLVKDLMTHVGSFGGKAKGKLTVTLDFSAEDNHVMVIGSVSVKSPKFPRQRTLFFSDKNFNLSTKDPKQTELPLTAVPNDPVLADVPVPNAAVRKV